MVASSSKEKFGLLFVLTLENTFSQRFHFKAIRKSIGSSKKRYQGFSKFLRLRDRHVFMQQSRKVLNVFNILTLKVTFWKTKTFFQKKLGYRFLVESTKIENASFPYKTAISEANVKTNKMVTSKWTYQKERSFAGNYFIFLKILFQFKSLF